MWRRITDVLEQEIGRGVHQAGARLPSETQLARRFGVNRHTVRRAMEELARAGLAAVERGRGSFVPEDVLDYAVGSRPRFSEWMRAQNREPSGRTLALDERTADAALAATLGLQAGDAVLRFERLGLADGRPVALATHCFPAARLPGLREALTRCPTITEALHQVGVADYRRQSTRVTARMPGAEEAALLGVARARPLLVTETVNVDAAGSPVEFGTACYPSSRVQLVFEP